MPAIEKNDTATEYSALPKQLRSTKRSIAGVAKVDYEANDILDPPSGNFVLCLVQRGRANTSFRFSDSYWTGQIAPGMFTPVTPPNVLGEIRIGAPQRHLVVSFPCSLVASVLNSSGASLGVVHKEPFRDALLSQICLSLFHAAEDQDNHVALFEEYALAALIVGLARIAIGNKAAQPNSRSFSPREWALIDAYIGDQLETDLSLSTLADLVGMKQHAFIRSFKARTGFSPHQFVVRRRIERARHLLQIPSLSIAEVALRAGFADQAHMTSTFARLIHETPGRLRRREARTF